MWSTFFCFVLEIPEEIMLFNNQRSSLSYFKHKIMHIQTLGMELDWPEIWCLMEVSTLIYLHVLRFYFVGQKPTIIKFDSQ